MLLYTLGLKFVQLDFTNKRQKFFDNVIIHYLLEIWLQIEVNN